MPSRSDVRRTLWRLDGGYAAQKDKMFEQLYSVNVRRIVRRADIRG
jgi:hypothetical protein